MRRNTCSSGHLPPNICTLKTINPGHLPLVMAPGENYRTMVWVGVRVTGQNYGLKLEFRVRWLGVGLGFSVLITTGRLLVEFTFSLIEGFGSGQSRRPRWYFSGVEGEHVSGEQNSGEGANVLYSLHYGA